MHLRSHVSYTGDDTDLPPRRNGSSRGLSELVLASHGFLLLSANPATPAPPCPYCGGPLYPAAWYCELTTEVDRFNQPVSLGRQITPETDDGMCECSWCILGRMGAQPGDGRPRKHCGKPTCKKAYDRERQREHRAARKQAVTNTP